MISRGMMVIVIIPTILAFLFGLFVLYSAIADVAERGAVIEAGKPAARCVKGCMQSV